MSRRENKASSRRMNQAKRLLPVVSAVSAGLLAVHSAQGVNYTWNVLNAGDASGSWGVVTNWLPNLNVATGAADTALFNKLDISVDSVISLNSPQTLGTAGGFPNYNMFFGDTNTATAAGWTINATSATANDATNILTLTNGFEIVYVDKLGTGKAVTINATISNASATGNGLAKSGPGALVLTANNSALTGTTAVNNGTLMLDFSQAWSPVANIIGDTSTGSAAASHLQLQGGTFVMKGKSGVANAQTFSNGAAMELGQSTILFNVNGATSVSLGLGTLSRNVGGAMDVSLPSSGAVSWAPGASAGAYPGTALGTTTGTNGLLVDVDGSAYATVNNSTDWAANNAGNIVPASTISGFYTPSTGSALAGNADLVTNSTLTGATSVSSLRMNDATGHTVDVGGTVLSTGGILVTQGSGALTIQNGTLNATATAAGGDFIINQNNTTNPMTVSAIIGNATAGATALTKNGAGTLILSGSNTYSGTTIINSGAVVIAGGQTGVTNQDVQVAPAYGNSGTLIVNSGILNAQRVITGANSGNFAGGNGTLLQTGGTINSGQWFSMGGQGSGTFIMSGGTLNQNATNGTEMEVGVFGTGRGFISMTGSSQINLFNNAPLVMGVFDTSGGTFNQNSGAVTFYSDAGTTVGGNGNLVIGNDAGSSVYSLNGGTLSVGAISHGSAGTGILNLNGGTLKATRASATFIGGTVTARSSTGGAIIDTNGLTVTAAAAIAHDPALGATPDGGLTKNGAGILRLSGASTYTGTTNINSGTLQLVNTAGIPVAVGNYSFDNVRDTSNNPVTSGSLGDNYTVVNSGSGGTTMNGTVNNSENLIGPGTASGTIVPGKFGNALSLDGLGSSVDINSQIVDQSGGNVSTMNIWIKTDSTGAGGTFVGKNAGADTWAVGHTAYYLGSPAATRATPGSLPSAVRFAGGFEQANTSVTDNNWHMLTYVDTGAGKQIYIDGVLASLNESGADGVDTSTFTRLGFNIDTFAAVDGTTNYAGAMDELKFFNIALTPTQIGQLFATNTITTANTGGQFLPAASGVNITASGAALDLNGVNQTIGSLAGVTGSLVSLGNATMTTGGNNTSTAFAGIISGSGGIIKAGTGTFTMSGPNTYTGTTAVQAGTVRLVGVGAQTPVFSGGGADISGGKLVLDYSDGSTTSAALETQVKNVLTAGFGQATKFSSGALRTSNTPDSSKGLGWKDDTANSKITVAYTYYGDADLSGTVNMADFNILAAHFNTSGTWGIGDFNYDGVVNLLDLNAIATNYGKTPLAIPGDLPALGALVPEPTSLGLMGVGMMALAARRKRQR